MPTKALEEFLSQAALWIVATSEPWLREFGLLDLVDVSDFWLEVLFDFRESLGLPVLVFLVTWLSARLLLWLLWRPLRLGRFGPWWKSFEYIWYAVVMFSVLAVAVDVRQTNLKAEMAWLVPQVEAGMGELESRVARAERRCLGGAFGQHGWAPLRGPSQTGIGQDVLLPGQCDNAKVLHRAIRELRDASSSADGFADLVPIGSSGHTTWREFAKEVEGLEVYAASDRAVQFVLALESQISSQYDFGPGRQRWTGFGWMDRDLAAIRTARAELTRLRRLGGLLVMWPYLLALAMGLRLVKIAAERRIERDRTTFGRGFGSAVIEHFITAGADASRIGCFVFNIWMASNSKVKCKRRWPMDGCWNLSPVEYRP